MPIYINGVPYRNLEDQVKYLTEGYNDLSLIKTYIPVDASATNQLASKSYVDQSVTTVAAHYLTSDASGNNFPTKAALLAGPYYYGADLHDPDENDYAFVNADESHSNLPSRYAYINDAWQYQYSLQASGGVVDLTSAQTVSGVKSFPNGIKIGTQFLTGSGTDFVFDGNLQPRYAETYDLGWLSARWKDLYLSGKIDLGNGATVQYLSDYGQIITSKGMYINGPTSTGDLIPVDTNYFSLGNENKQWKDLYLSGNIIGSYKEANEVTISGNIATAHFNMNADTVNKIKYIEIFVGNSPAVGAISIPVAAWNMSEWTTSTLVNNIGGFNVSVMFNSNGLYVAVSDTGSTSVQVFAKMI